MKSIVVNPDQQTVEMIDTKTFEEALKKAGLNSGEVDWSGIGRTEDRRSITLMAYEFGLRPDMAGKPLDLKYCRIGRQMYAGNLLIFAADEQGENADMTKQEIELLAKHLEWLPNKEACEMAITAGKLDRPTMSVNGGVIWRWNIDDE